MPGRAMRWMNIAATALWAAMMPIAYYAGWLSSVPFVSVASIYANFASHLAAWRADTDPHAEQLDRIEAMLKELLNAPA